MQCGSVSEMEEEMVGKLGHRADHGLHMEDVQGRGMKAVADAARA